MNRLFGMRNLFLVVFVLFVALKLLLSFSYFPLTEGDDRTWYFLGYHTLGIHGLNDTLSDEMADFHQKYYLHEEMILTAPYLPVLWYFMAALVKISGNEYFTFDMIYIALLNLADMAIFFLIYKILRIKKVSERTAFLLSLIYFINPVNLDNLKWRQFNTFSILFLTASVYFFMIKEKVKSSLAFSISYVFKLIAVYLFPVFLLKSDKRLKTFLLMTAIPLAGTFIYMAASPFDFTRDLVFGAHVSGEDTWTISFAGLFALLGLNSPIIPLFFLSVMLVSMMISYFVFRKESITSFIFIILSLYFLFANLIEIHHIPFLYAALIMNWKRFALIRKLAPFYFLIPLGWFFATQNAIGTRIAYSFGFSGIPYIQISIATIVLFKLLIAFSLWPYFRQLKIKALRSDFSRQLDRIIRFK